MKVSSLKKPLLISCLGLALLAEASCASDWPMFMGDAKHSGQAGGDLSFPANKPLKPSWQYALHSQVSASPIVVDRQLLVAAENGNLYSFDLATKKLLWLYHAEGGIGSTPAAADGKVYFLSRDGKFNALELASGKLLWRFATGGESRFGIVGSYGQSPDIGVVPDPWDFYLSSPLVKNGKVFFGSSDHHVYALDAATGAQVWKFDAGESLHSSPAYANGRIFIGTYDTKLYALDANTGHEYWHFQGGVDYDWGVMMGMAASPTVDGDNVYIGSRDGNLYAFKQADGSPAWAQPYNAGGSWVLSTAAVDEKNLYFATSDSTLFIAADKKTGQERYRVDTKVWTYTSPVIIENRFVFYGTMAGELFGLDKTTGKKLWYYQTPEARADINDFLDDKTGKLRTDKLYAPEVQLQAQTELVKPLGGFMASPIWAYDQLIAVTGNGDILSFSDKNR